MNRSALVIKMLHILRAHNEVVPLSVLATELETSVRNVREFKKELEVAGYQIDAKRGINGGYYLNQATLLPTITLTNEEDRAIDMAVKLLAQKPEFLNYNDFVSACGKFRNNNSSSEPIRTIYQQSTTVKMNEKLQQMVNLLQDAVIHNNVVELTYASLSSKKTRHFKIHPYDVVNVNGSYYVVGYALEHHEFRSYKVSQERMKKVVLLDQTFHRDSTYQLSHYIGNKSIAKTKEQTVSLQISGDLAVYVSENEIGLRSSSHFEGDVLHLTTTFENEKACDSFILSLGTNGVVVSPPEIRERIQSKLQTMIQNLSSNVAVGNK